MPWTNAALRVPITCSRSACDARNFPRPRPSAAAISSPGPAVTAPPHQRDVAKRNPVIRRRLDLRRPDPLARFELTVIFTGRPATPRAPPFLGESSGGFHATDATGSDRVAGGFGGVAPPRGAVHRTVPSGSWSTFRRGCCLSLWSCRHFGSCPLY